MLQITIPATECFDEQTSTFITIKEQTLQLEHSLVSISKWESKWKKPFLLREEKTRKQSIDYVRCMTLTQNVSPDVYRYITPKIFAEINAYIESPATATTFRKNNRRSDNRVITSEIIYYWMVELGIPFECQKWHLNRLMTLIRVCNEENAPKKKMSRKEIAAQNRALNNERRARAHSKG